MIAELLVDAYCDSVLLEDYNLHTAENANDGKHYRMHSNVASG